MSEKKHHEEPEVKTKDAPRDPPTGGSTTDPNSTAIIDHPSRGDDDQQ